MNSQKNRCHPHRCGPVARLWTRARQLLIGVNREFTFESNSIKLQLFFFRCTNRQHFVLVMGSRENLQAVNYASLIIGSHGDVAVSIKSPLWWRLARWRVARREGLTHMGWECFARHRNEPQQKHKKTFKIITLGKAQKTQQFFSPLLLRSFSSIHAIRMWTAFFSSAPSWAGVVCGVVCARSTFEHNVRSQRGLSQSISRSRREKIQNK